MTSTSSPERDAVARTAERIAAAIARRDLPAIRELLAPEFVHRTHGGQAVQAEQFLAAIGRIPGEILFVKLERLDIDLSDGWALVTGVQHAQVRVDGQVVDDRRGFVDLFVHQAGTWRIQAAVDLPGIPDQGSEIGEG
jgi:hypothetical protein